MRHDFSLPSYTRTDKPTDVGEEGNYCENVTYYTASCGEVSDVVATKSNDDADCDDEDEERGEGGGCLPGHTSAHGERMRRGDWRESANVVW